MDIYQIRNELKSTGRTLFDMPLRVAYYARVSTDRDEQLNSLGNQQSHYEDFISKNPNWVMAGAYVDEGLSAITTAKRENFHAMINHAREGRFDFVITKEISRFARNTLDSIRFTRDLLASGVAVWFQQDSINTIDDDSEMRLAIMSSLAQEESRKLSSRIRFGHEQSIKKGVVMGNSRIYGYEKAGGKLVINEAEAEMVRLIYELYATGDYSTPKIEKILDERGYRNIKGSKINRNVLGGIIKNPKYKGFYCGNKVKVVDMFTKKQKFLDEQHWEMYRDHDKVPPIVTDDLWERANVVFSQRSADVKSRRTSYKTDNLFTGKIICAEHDTPFYLKSRGSWVCSHRIKNGKDSCDTIGIKEDELKIMLGEVLVAVASSTDELVTQYLQFLQNVDTKVDNSKRVKQLEGEIAKIGVKKDKLLELNMDGSLSNTEFRGRNDVLNEEAAKLEQEIKELLAKQEGNSASTSNIQNFKSRLLEYINSPEKELSSGVVQMLVDKIWVRADSDGMGITIALNTGISAENRDSRSGHTNKKMIEAQERQMAGQQPQ
ncbi:MAG: recombinase family protein [Defluviitaleaceae bacterium]|nr:recombinase family protein [Defluviitaleaceae bacterium]